MISFITENVYRPWSSADIAMYEKDGSQRDTVLYNSHYNSRILLSDKNLYQCSIRVNQSTYKNFYLFAVRRNLFYFIMYIPQMEAIKEIENEKIIKSLIERLPTVKQFIRSRSQQGYSKEAEIQFFDGNSVLLRVDANIGEFLFPKRGYITNDEIKNKYAQLNNIYTKCINEIKKLGDMLECYDKKLREQLAIREQKLKKILIRKGIRVGASLGIALLTGVYLDLDTAFGFEDIADAADIMDMMDVGDMADGLDYVGSDIDFNPSDGILDDRDFSDTEMEGDTDVSGISFMGEPTPSFDTGSDVHVVSEYGVDKGNFDVYTPSNSNKKYIKFRDGSSSNWSNWVELKRGESCFSWLGVKYYFK